MVFTPKDAMAIKDPEYSTFKAPDNYFSPRANCRVTLYQDGDTPPGSIQVKITYILILGVNEDISALFQPPLPNCSETTAFYFEFIESV